MAIKDTYIQYGVPNNWALKYEKIGLSVATYKATSKKNLSDKYGIPNIEINFVKECLTRQPIDETIVQRLLENNRFICCLCKGQKSDAYVIHHIKEYSKTKDNTYNNLALLCPNDHDLAHREGIALTNKITEKQIKEAKKTWENFVKIENKKKALTKIKFATKDWRSINPYKELQSYKETDKEFFFGRNEEITELLSKISKYHIVGLFGESGTGKTSLINAGLIPHLKDDDFVIISVRCLDEPIKRIKEELFKQLRECKFPAYEIEELALTDTFPRLINKLNTFLGKSTKNIVIVIDQFEELFTRSRENEREQLSKGITEALLPNNTKLFFLISIREDYLGELWNWSHNFNLEEAWIQQFRISRFNDKKAFEVITQPLDIIGIKVNIDFINELISELKTIGDSYIYPPYLQILCSELYETYKLLELNKKPTIEFNKNLYKENESAETIIADYLSESMLIGLTEEEKIYAKNILDLLTGPEGLRTFLNADEISNYLKITLDSAKHVIEHLIKKKIVHVVVEEDKVIGYELVHDFLSKKFFEKLSPEARKVKTTIDIFRRAFREWKQHGVLASKDRLDLIFPNIKQLILTDEEWFFIIKSSFSVFWYSENKWVKITNQDRLKNICLKLVNDNDERIVKHSLYTLGGFKTTEFTEIFINIIESSTSNEEIKDTAIHQFSFNIVDERILGILKKIIKNEKKFKLRKTALFAFGQNLNALSKYNKELIDDEIPVIYEALNDSITNVRKQAADILSYWVVTEKSVKPLLNRLKVEFSISSRKSIVSALHSLYRKGYATNLISPVLMKIYNDSKEDYRVREEAKLHN